MRKVGIALALFCVGAGFVFLAGGQPTADAGDKKIVLDHKRLKAIIAKLDPEIKAAQISLQRSKKDIEAAHSRIKAAILDEVFGETGTTEGHVIDQLKLADKHAHQALIEVNAAIKHANIAQLLDTGK
jgi:hypothetical protein